MCSRLLDREEVYIALSECLQDPIHIVVELDVPRCNTEARRCSRVG